MRIVYFSQKAQLWAELEKVPGEKIFVTPSPAKADSLRAQLPPAISGDVITINNFTTSMLTNLWSDEDRPKFKRKADLLLIFGFLKNKMFSDLGYEQFVQSYNLFSDLRSFTLNQEALSTVLEEQPIEIRSTVEKFWQLIESIGYSDEHSTYQQIAEILRSSEEKEELKKTYVISGFQHLNGQQVDLLKALAIRYSVIIPFPLSLKPKLKRSDWVLWLQEDKVQVTELPEIQIHPRGAWAKINSRELSPWLQTHLNENVQVVLGVAKLSTEHLDIIPSTRVGFKIPHNLIETEILEFASQLQKDRPKDLSLYLGQAKSLILSISHKRTLPFKKLKTIQLFEEALLSLKELTDELFIVDSFSIKLLRDVVLLNQPRTSYSPISSVENLIELKDMSSLEEIDRTKKVILCVDDRFQDIQSLGQNYTESIQKHLAALGPLKRNDLDLSFKQWEFENLFSQNDVLVLMPESVLKHNLIWKRLFTSIDLEILGDDLKRVDRMVIDSFQGETLKKYDGGFSASRLQAYVDCPRKFYYSYVEKLEPNIELEKDIDQKISGTLIHKIIEEFYHRNLEEKDLVHLTQEIFDHHLKEAKLSLPDDVYHQRKLIFSHRALNGIKFLKQVEEALGEKVTWSIEEKFTGTEDFPLGGSMDCLGTSSKYILLLDFKSSDSAASSNKEIENFESFQLWVYSLAAKRKLTDFSHKEILVGYVVLDDPSLSNLLTSDEDLFHKLKQNKVGAPAKFKELYSDKLTMSWEKIQTLMSDIKKDEKFLPLPRSGCQYCMMINVCPKGPIHV